MSRALGVLLVLVFALPACADNLATEWLDRVTHEVQQEDGPLSTRPLDFKVFGGVYAYYTDNIFLQNNKLADGDSAGIGFLRGRLDYTGTELEISADLMARFDYYSEHQQGREDQEYFYGKIRWTDGVWDLQLVEIARRETDPLDAVFTDHVRRIITDTMPRVGVKMADLLRLEAFGLVETVHFEGDEFDGRENESYRGGLAVLFDVSPRISVGADGGIMGIHYRQEETTYSSVGVFARGVLRGEPMDKLLIEMAAGWAGIRSRIPGDPDTDRRRNRSTFDAELHVRWEATSTMMIYFDYTRRYGFAGFGDPYQHVDRFVFLAEWQALEKLKLRGRAQYDHVKPTETPVRTYWAGTISATLQVIKNLAIDGGVTYRGGDTRQIRDDNYDNWVFYLGLVFNF